MLAAGWDCSSTPRVAPMFRMGAQPGFLDRRKSIAIAESTRNEARSVLGGYLEALVLPHRIELWTSPLPRARPSRKRLQTLAARNGDCRDVPRTGSLSATTLRLHHGKMFG